MLALAWLVLPLGALVTAGVCALTLRGSSSQDAAYVQGVIIHGACTAPPAVELCDRRALACGALRLRLQPGVLRCCHASMKRPLATT